MAELVIMPKLGFNMEVGTLVKWHKQEGQMVKKGETLFEITTDKASIEIEATVEGIVRKLLVREGETVPVTTAIAIIGLADEDISRLLQEASPEAVAGVVKEKRLYVEGRRSANPAGEIGGIVKITPRARKLLAERNMDLSEMNLQGTGSEGGITARDVLRDLGRLRATPVAAKMAAARGIDLCGVSGTGVRQKIMKADVQKAIAEKGQLQHALPEYPGKKILETRPYEGIRKIIGERLSQSKFTAPHIYFSTSVDVSELYRLRDEVSRLIQMKVSLNDMIIAAAAGALVKNPAVNSSLENDTIVVYESVNIGVAVALEQGLIVPVIKDAQEKKLSGIARAARELVGRARAGKLFPDEYNGGTFTVSNLGMYGIEDFTAVINPPEAAILAVASVKKTPVVMSADGREGVEIRPIMKMTLSVDHRIIDGAVAARFLKDVKDFLECPMKFLI